PRMNGESLMATSYSPSLKTQCSIFYFQHFAYGLQAHWLFDEPCTDLDRVVAPAAWRYSPRFLRAFVIRPRGVGCRDYLHRARIVAVVASAYSGGAGSVVWFASR